MFRNDEVKNTVRKTFGYFAGIVSYLDRVEIAIDMDGRFFSGGCSLLRQLDHGVGQALQLADVCAALADDSAHLRRRSQNLHGQADVHAAGEALFAKLLVDKVLSLEITKIRFNINKYYLLV